MASLSFPTPVERQVPQPAGSEALLIVGFQDPVAADYAAFVRRQESQPITVVTDAEQYRRVETPPPHLGPRAFPGQPAE